MKRLHVLFATDGSAAAKAAVATAVRFPWPEATRASVVVARHARAASRRSILRAALDRTAESAARSASRAVGRRWPDADVRVVDAAPVDAIIREAARCRADVIVMGWRGHGVLRRLMSGSVSRGVVRRASCSVLVVRRARRGTRRLVLGFDGSAYAQRAVNLIASLNPPRGGRVRLVTAVDTMPVPSRALMAAGTRAAVSAEVKRVNQQRRAAAERALERAARVLVRAGWAVEPVVTTGAPLRDLLAAIAARRADLLVVGAKGVSGVRHLLLGSVAEGALDRSPVPVLVVR